MKNKKSLLHSISAAPHIFWAVLFIVVPLIIVIFYAFTVQNPDGSYTFSFSNIASLPDYISIFGLSLELSVIATAVCLVVGYPLAYIMARSKPKTQKILVMLLMLPMWTNLLIRTYSLMAILDNNGILNQLLGTSFQIVGTKGAVIFGMVYDFLPYMVLPIYTCLSKIDKYMWEAAADLGCDTPKTLVKVILPLSRSGIISGVTMVLVPSIRTFSISQKLGGGTFELIGDTIERQFVTGALNVGAAISLVMMVLILISLTIMNKFGDSEDGGIIV
nr:ABC transporter permease [Clostridia bacterium]